MLSLKDIPVYREKLWNSQGRKCPLCGDRILKKDAALDHDHIDGRCRGTLHRNCNSIEGRILHWARRSGTDPVEFLRNLLAYWEKDYSSMPLHPRHKTETQKEITKLRRRLRRLKTERGKQRVRDQIKQLQSR